jgi:hypothetical protein
MTAPLLFADAESLRAAEKEGAFQAVTAPGAALRYGPLYLKAVVDACLPGKGDEAVIDCGGDVALVLRALAAGWRRVFYSGSPDMALKLESLAEKRGAGLIHGRGIEEIDRSERGTKP